jgi:hypothetical protein
MLILVTSQANYIGEQIKILQKELADHSLVVKLKTMTKDLAEATK